MPDDVAPEGALLDVTPTAASLQGSGSVRIV